MALHLNFNLETQQQRSDFVNKYLETYEPTERELNIIADYILWGKNDSGLNGRQQGLDLRARNSPWNRPHESVSLEELRDQGWEQSDWEQTSTMPVSKPKAHLSRDSILEQFADQPDALSQFQALWTDIDELDWALGNRRPALRERLTRHWIEWHRGLEWGYYGIAGAPSSKPQIGPLEASESMALDGYFADIEATQHPSKRHLVELRTRQYELKDQFSSDSGVVIDPPNSANDIGHPTLWDWEAGIAVLPLGTVKEAAADLGALWDAHLGDACAHNWWSEDRLRALDKFLRSRQSTTCDTNGRVVSYRAINGESTPSHAFDFRKVEHVTAMANNIAALRQEAAIANYDDGLRDLVTTWDWYVRKANLNPMQSDLLELRSDPSLTNQQIADRLNEKYGHKYTANYVSCIFGQQVVKAIAEAATMHELEAENLFYPENFKQCSKCGHFKLRHELYWTRRARATDGWTSMCKECSHK